MSKKKQDQGKWWVEEDPISANWMRAVMWDTGYDPFEQSPDELSGCVYIGWKRTLEGRDRKPLSDGDWEYLEAWAKDRDPRTPKPPLDLKAVERTWGSEALEKLKRWGIK